MTANQIAPSPWTAEQLASLCRGLGMEEHRNLDAFRKARGNLPCDTSGPAFLVFHDAARRVTVLPETLTLCTPFRVGPVIHKQPGAIVDELARLFDFQPMIPTEFVGMTEDGLACFKVDSRIVGR